MEIIAEIGTGHSGDLIKAREMVHAAKEAGADTVKFQAVYAEEILHPRSGTVLLHGIERPLYEEFLSLERHEDFYAQLKTITESAGLNFLCSVFGIKSARMIKSIGGQRIKVASPELNHLPLLRELSGYGMPLILSSGVSTAGDIEEALDLVRDSKPSILHCVTAYPAPPEDYMLSLLPHMAGVFGVPFGVSDHSLDPLIVPLTAMVFHAAILEKHMTLSRKDSGLDDPIALEPDAFRTMCREIKNLESVKDSERLAIVQEMLGESFQAAAGKGYKHLAPSEKDNYGRTNRSLHAVRALKKGEFLQPGDIAVLRTEKKLGPGLHPRFLNQITGARLTRNVESGEGLVWEDILDYGVP